MDYGDAAAKKIQSRAAATTWRMLIDITEGQSKSQWNDFYIRLFDAPTMRAGDRLP